MLPNKKDRKDEYDYYITLEEIKVLLKVVNQPKVRPHHKLMTWFLILTGRRVGEICAVQVQDFQGHKDFDFSKLQVRLEKTGQVVTVPIVEPLQQMIVEYLTKYHDRLVGGYLFPKSGFKALERPFMETKDYHAFFSKARQRASKWLPSFSEVYPNGIHRIHPHTLRHFFEDYGLELTNSLLFVKELMGYKDISTVLVYANRKRIREQVPKYYDQHMNNLCKKLDGLTEGQEALNKWS